ncbi:30S ribosomal protein S19e [Candidatus Micrarchaeota archaeon CG08_land_8_20_14_0_20_59_11]|nr:MAG: 30S ribosomal protein S19e [Candidatus Micrarchaeota archaeon CG08_land_8_20_14_0_20_59_11]PIT85661.1 MAG: 30S ribosomal protein S19e [Candidatus Micrarchaeota archaeon CG10_big_fil_rev_8_21_14_0_10_59_7]
MSASDIQADTLIKAVAEELKNNPAVKKPEWLDNVKSGSHAERIPADEDFWFVRCASLLYTLYFKSSGVRRLRHRYGGRKEHVVHRAHHRMAGGKIIRAGLQHLEAAGFVRKEKAGRVITDAGKALLDKAVKV